MIQNKRLSSRIYTSACADMLVSVDGVSKVINKGTYFIVGPVAQSVYQLTISWKVRDRIPVGTRLSARPDWPWGPPSLMYNGYRVFPEGRGDRRVGLIPHPI